MLTTRVSSLALFSIFLVAPLSARAASPVVRTKNGVLYEIPAGWDWGGYNGYGLTIQHQGTSVDGKSPNRFEVGTTDDYAKFYDGGWDTTDVEEQRSYPDGVKAHWKAGLRYGMHYAFSGVAMVAGKGVKVTILDNRTPVMDMKLVAAAFESIARSLKSAAKSTAIHHPTLGFSAEPLEEKFWYSESGPRNMSYKCWNDGHTGGTTIYAYPVPDFKDTTKALADLTGQFEKEQSLKIGKVQSSSLSGGEILWTEQPGSAWPFLSAVRRDGQIFVIGVNAAKADACLRAASRKDVFAIAKSLRSWDGK